MIIHGDSKEELKKLDGDSVDLLCTDPPYGYSFMGKAWDKALPDIEIFKECFRVLKPGAFAFVMSAPRSDVCSRMAILLEDAGFRIDFTPIYWTYASGFPKAMNIGKMIDKRLGLENIIGYKKAGTTAMGQNSGWNNHENTVAPKITAPVSNEAKALDGSYGGFQPKPAVEVIIVAMKPLSEKAFVDQALKNGKGITWLDDCRVPSESRSNPQYGTGGDLMAISKGGEQKWDGTKEIVSGRFPANRLVSDDVLNDGVNRKSGKMTGEHIAPNSYGGYRTPTETTSYADSGSYSRFFSLDAWAQTLPFLAVPKASKSKKNKGLGSMCTVKYNTGICKDENMVAVQLLERVTSGSMLKWATDERGENIMALCPLDSLSTTKTTISKITKSQILNSLTLSLTSAFTPAVNYGMVNGGSLAVDVESLRAWLLTITNDETELARGVSNAASQTLSALSKSDDWTEQRNIHSTVKPLKLMSYLITLGSRPGDTVLDPFAGSGTTCIAAKELGREYIGIEREQEYVEIAEARLKSSDATLF